MHRFVQRSRPPWPMRCCGCQGRSAFQFPHCLLPMCRKQLATRSTENRQNAQLFLTIGFIFANDTLHHDAINRLLSLHKTFLCCLQPATNMLGTRSYPCFSHPLCSLHPVTDLPGSHFHPASIPPQTCQEAASIRFHPSSTIAQVDTKPFVQA